MPKKSKRATRCMTRVAQPISKTLASLKPVDARAVTCNINETEMNIAQYTAQLYMNDDRDLERGAQGIYEILLEGRDADIETVISMGAVPRLLHCLTHAHNNVRYHAIWALTNIASGTRTHVEYLANINAIPQIVHFMAGARGKLRVQACWAVGNIAGEDAVFRTTVIEAGAVPLIVQILTTRNLPKTALHIASWAMLNVCRGTSDASFEQVQYVIPTASKLIYHSDHEIRQNALWTLVFLSDGDPRRQAAIATPRACRRLIQLTMSDDKADFVPALRVICNLTIGHTPIVQCLIDHGMLRAFALLLQHTSCNVLRETCWALSNILADSHQHIQNVMDAHLFPMIMHCMHSEHATVRQEAAWCVINAFGGAKSAQIYALVAHNHNVIGHLFALLWSPIEKQIAQALYGLERVLHVGVRLTLHSGHLHYSYMGPVDHARGKHFLMPLTMYECASIREHAQKLLTIYWAHTD